MRRENTGAAGWKRAGVFAGMAVLAAVLSGCGNGAEADFSLAEPAWTEEQTSPAEPARTEAQPSPASFDENTFFWRRPPETGGWPGQRQRII